MYAQNGMSKENVICVSRHNSPILAHMQLKTMKGACLIVEQSFGVQMVCICHTIIELRMRETRNEQNGNYQVRFSGWEKD